MTVGPQLSRQAKTLEDCCSPSIFRWWDSPSGGVIVMERPDDEESLGGVIEVESTDDEESLGGVIEVESTDDEESPGGVIEVERPDDEGSPGGVIEVERPDDEESPGEVIEVERPDDEESLGGVIEVESTDDEESLVGVIEVERPDDEESPGEVNEVERPDDEESPGEVIEVERPDDEESLGGVIEVERPDDEESPGKVIEVERPDDEESPGEVIEVESTDDEESLGEVIEVERPDDEQSPGGIIEVERPDDEQSPGGIIEVERPDDEQSPGGIIEVERPDDEQSPGGIIEVERPDEASPGGFVEVERPDDEGSPGVVVEVERPDDEGSPGGVIEVERPDDEESPCGVIEVEKPDDESSPGGVIEVERPGDEASPSATGGEWGGRDTTPVHNTGTAGDMAALRAPGANLQGVMFNQPQQQQSMQQAVQQQIQQQFGHLQEEVQKGKTKEQCVVTPLPAANPDTLTRPAPQSLDPAEEVLGEHLDKKEEAEMKSEEVQQPLSKANDETKPETDGSSGGNRETTRGQSEVLDQHVVKKDEAERPDPEISAPYLSNPEKGLKEKTHQGEQGEQTKCEEEEPLSQAIDEPKPEEGSSRGNIKTTQVIPAPDQLNVDPVDTTSAAVSWSQPPGLDQTQHHYQISYHCAGTEPHITTTSSHSITLSDLQCGTQYSVTVCTVLENGKQSQLVSTTLTTDSTWLWILWLIWTTVRSLLPFIGQQSVLPAPDQLTVDSVDTTSAAVSWSQPPGLDQTQHHYQISYHCPGTEPHITTTSSHSITLSDLQCGAQYSVTVCTVVENGKQSQLVSTTLTTILPALDQLTVKSVDSTSAAVSWSQPPGLDQTQHHYQISYHCPGTEPHITTTSSHSITLSDLKPATEYSVTVCTVLENGEQSQLVSTTLTTRSCLRELLSKTGLEDHYENKLALSTVLEINDNTTSDEPLTTMQSLPGAFLKKLMMANVNARSVKCLTTDQDVSYYGVDNLDTDSDTSDVINPLDLITALFLCSDVFLQQEMVQKMSMCQFAVPLLLPNCDTKQCTLMLWALRDIVRKFRPSSQTDSKAFVEERIVLSDIPMVSFVRLGESSLSKSQILNKFLSNPQQYHDTFIHHDMECGEASRQISDGLVEISWYFPCGNRNIDMFTKPVAVANLRGDIRSFETQFSFLCQTSVAVYIFSDDLEADFFKVLKSKKTKAELFLVVNCQRNMFRVDTLKRMISNGSIKETNVIVKKKQNDAEFVKTLQSSVGDVIGKSPNRLTIENMVDVAHQMGIWVDEDCGECQSARKMADEITRNIKDTNEFKDQQLQLQGQIWKELSQLEKERCRLRKAGDQDIEHYKSSLKKNEEELRKKQYTFDISDAMARFILGLSSSGAERSYFLKWMRINLDNLSRQNLSGLREQYKDLCQHYPEKKDNINLLGLGGSIFTAG
ncbi:uncharacterized protein [Salmo salar]|uniref:Fibronectin type-III domain-containing protein n=1 Tax=Salmo salar TaxID=8030 RepID=A0ABM3EMQ3_SALSA|nr:uncharacterized protein LOC106610457 [Salmo salar]